MTTSRSLPSKPQRIDVLTLPADKAKLQQGVRDALAALPIYFDFDNPIRGIDATDLHNINTLMGAAIENEVVRSLNSLRRIWDANNEWSDFSFQRSSQAFPDVRLVRHNCDGTTTTEFGIELKGWWLLAKEGVPSLRYQVAPDACAPWDLVCVVPWYLDNAVSGVPSVAEPWVEQAKYAAEWRDYWWTYIRKSSSPQNERGVILPVGARPYPAKADVVSVKPIKDGGNNFGRLPRARPLMDVFIEKSLEMPILGIPALHWQRFLHIHAENAEASEIVEEIMRMTNADTDRAKEQAESLMAHLRAIASDYGFADEN